MTLSEKIQQLRKTNNLSQEQLAEKLAVSRQAISKWELGESTPDTDKIILLSRIFKISTDYLLHDDISSDKEIPAVKTSSELLKKHYGLKTLFIITTGVSIIGLLMSIIAQLTWQTIFSVSVGLIVQIIGVIIFEAMSSHYITRNGNKGVRKGFYALNVWFILPFPVIFLSDLFFNFYPRPRGYGIDLIFTAIVYVTLCGIITFILKKKSKYS
ncbi:MAG TPA: helix-turn-helix transcriptional regulator [Tissierellaceae bacterium]|nr:helix-turn-helix transcriptional regulator [Tissierellaceae bacterium]